MELTDVRLLVKDIDSCRAFYKEKLGLPEQLAVVEGIYYEFKVGDCVLSLYKKELMERVVGIKADQFSGDRVALILRVEDVDETYAKLSAEGVEFVTEPHNQEAWFQRVAHFRDPEGNLIEIYTSTYVPSGEEKEKLATNKPLKLEIVTKN